MCAQGASHVVLVGDHFPHFFQSVIIFGLIHCVRRVPLTLCLWETISRTFSKVLLILV